MQCKIRGEKIKATSAITEYIESKMSKIDKYFKDSTIPIANVLLKIKGKKTIN